MSKLTEDKLKKIRKIAKESFPTKFEKEINKVLFENTTLWEADKTLVVKYSKAIPKLVSLFDQHLKEVVGEMEEDSIWKDESVAIKIRNSLRKEILARNEELKK